MKSIRLLVILLAGIIAIVAGAFAWTLGREDNPTDASASSTVSVERTGPATRSTVEVSPPTVDLFGNRLEIPAAEAGVALAQDPTLRPDPGRADYLTAPPASMQWQRVWAGAALPVSSSDGPARVDNGIASGFAHTPQGAILAALDALGRALAAPEGTWQQVVNHRYYYGGGALESRFARSRERTRDSARYVVVPDGVRVQPGYRNDLAVVQVAHRTEGGYSVATWPMAWRDGDWRVRVPSDVETLWGPAELMPDLTGFGSWKSQP